MSGVILGKLAQMNCASLDPQEIARCFAGCCSPRKLTKKALEMVERGDLTMEAIKSQ